ncbi:hypothetical protein C1704_17345, partial [Caldimonas caldifontis]
MLGRVILDHGKHKVVIDKVSILSTQEELDGPLVGEGLKAFSFSAYVGESSEISHDAARREIHGLLQQILNAGWQPLVSRSRPRLQGRYRLEHTLATSNINGLDPAYLPTLEEW